jgi:hypothetical protein
MCKQYFNQATANARLIAASPMLLEALKNLIRLNEPGILEGLDEARAAIAAAEGN